MVIAGEKRVGKSSLVHRFIHEQFPLKDLYSTVGFDFTVKTATLYATLRVELNTDVAVHLSRRGITNHGQRQSQPKPAKGQPSSRVHRYSLQGRLSISKYVAKLGLES